VGSHNPPVIDTDIDTASFPLIRCHYPYDYHRDESFTSYRTPAYKLHLFETPTSYRFVLLSDASTDSLRFVLRQLYTGPFVEYVVRNPLIDMDSRTEGIDNDQVSVSRGSGLRRRDARVAARRRCADGCDQFRAAVDKHVRGLSMFGT
jgi:hypothetical protein